MTDAVKLTDAEIAQQIEAIEQEDYSELDADLALLGFRELQARRAGLEAWQDISTAPKDGEWILGYEDPEGMSAKYSPVVVMRWRSAAHRLGWFTDGGHGYQAAEPTHWRPLPLPPSAVQDAPAVRPSAGDTTQSPPPLGIEGRGEVIVRKLQAEIDAGWERFTVSADDIRCLLHSLPPKDQG